MIWVVQREYLGVTEVVHTDSKDPKPKNEMDEVDEVYEIGPPTRKRRRLLNYLHDAIVEGDYEWVKSLLSDGVDVNAVDDAHGDTCLVWAIEYHRVDIVRMLVEHGASPDITNRHGENAFHKLFEDAPVDTTLSMLNILLSAKPIPNDEFDAIFVTVLQTLQKVEHGILPEIKAEIDKVDLDKTRLCKLSQTVINCVRINRPSDIQETPLTMLCTLARVDVDIQFKAIKRVVEIGANILFDDFNPIMFIIEYQHTTEILEYFVSLLDRQALLCKSESTSPTMDLVHHAISVSSIPAFNFLLEMDNSPFSIDGPSDSTMMTYVEYAAKRDKIYMVIYLVLKRKVDITHCRDAVIDASIRHGHLNMLEYIVDKWGIDKQSAFSAAMEKYPTVLEFVVEQSNFSIDTLTPHGDTLLHVAVRYGHLDHVKYIISKFGCVDCVCEQNMGCHSPIDYAVMYDHIDILRYLLNPGIKAFETKDREYILNHAILVAKLHRHTEIETWLHIACRWDSIHFAIDARNYDDLMCILYGDDDKQFQHLKKTEAPTLLDIALHPTTIPGLGMAYLNLYTDEEKVIISKYIDPNPPITRVCLPTEPAILFRLMDAVLPWNRERHWSYSPTMRHKIEHAIWVCQQLNIDEITVMNILTFIPRWN